MTEEDKSIYQAPESELISNNQQGINIQRFTAWAVFGLGMITMGIYSMYWLYNRAKRLNADSDQKIPENLAIVLIVLSVLSNIVPFMVGSGGVFAMISPILTIAYLAIYVYLVFTFKNRLSERLGVKLGGILTFFFSAIYFQYKVNEYIDQREKT